MLETERNTAALEWGLSTLHDSVMAFCNVWRDLSQLLNYPRAEFQAVTRDLLVGFTRNPSAEEAAAWAVFPHSADQLERHFESFAPVMRWPEIVRAILDVERRPIGWWMEGTQALSPSLALALYLRLKRWKRDLKRKLKAVSF